MKQTKPYGRSHQTATKNASDAVADPSAPAPAEAAAQGQPAFEESPREAGPRPAPRPVAVHKPLSARSMARNFVLVNVAICLLLTGYVLIRDSIATVAAMDHVHTDDTVTECKNGSIQYRGYSIKDRLLGLGYFVCSDWHTENRYLHLPRGPHFIESTS